MHDNEQGYATRSGFPRAVLMAPTKELVIQVIIPNTFPERHGSIVIERFNCTLNIHCTPGA
jgi:hypothetical protein